jgi:hypothetical protein
MSHFNSAFRKSFLGTKVTQTTSAGVRKSVNEGFLTEAGVHSRYLSSTGAPYALGVGTFGFFNKDNYLSVVAGGPEVAAAAPLVLASSAILPKDKIGPFHGGYNESNKSKVINPRYISKFAKMTAAAPEQAIVHVGNTNLNAITATSFTPGVTVSNGTFLNLPTTSVGAGTGLTVDVVVAGGVVTSVKINSNGQNYATGDVLTIPANVAAAFTVGTAPTVTINEPAVCSFDFMCGETYNLAVELFGAPILKLLNHKAYKTYAANTGCCTSAGVTNVDSTLVMIDWANQIINDPIVNAFVRPIVYNQFQQPLFATAAEAVLAGYPATQIWANYGAAGAVGAAVSPGYVAGKVAGIRLVGAYVETSFGNCSFQLEDGFEKEIVNINVSLTDLTGNPCEFSKLCVTEESKGYQGQGFGESVLRDIIFDESYLQNTFHADQRLREINQGDQYLAITALNGGALKPIRQASFTRYVILHTTPRTNNPSGVYDNDQYALNIYVPAATATAFEAFMSTWLTNANQAVSLESYGHTAFVATAI